MIVTIQSHVLTVDIDTLGAQLASIRTRDGEEYLWQGDPDIWARRAPILFPFIGRLKDSTYALQGTPYTISTHGFARDMEFEVVEQTEDTVSFQLTHTPQTQAVYPFAFTLTVTYSLKGHVLTKTHRVLNRSSRDMFYELGAHDGFRVPVGEGLTMADYAIRLPGLERVAFYGMDENLMLTPKGEEIPLNSSALPLTPSTFGLDTMILDTPPQAKAVLCDKAGQPRVALEFPDFPYLGIWTQGKPFDTGYVCIEPWSTLPDGTFMGRELEDKTGIRRLAPGQSEELRYTTTIYEKGVYQHEA